jgi:hypothetical protein
MRALAWVLALLAGAACSRHLPPDPPTAALYRDLERLVTIEGTAGWGVDRLEVEGLLAPALDSACRVDPVRRRELLAWLDDEIAAAGGPVDEAWRRAGKDLGAVAHLLVLTRVRMVLAHADRHADADCPFWLEPDERFAGRQISDDRWHLSGGGGGKAIAILQGRAGDLSFGGAGRLLVGRSFGSRAGLYLGLEIGASASFPKDDEGERSQVVVGVDVVAPLVYRHTFVNSYLEVEAGPLGRATEEDPENIEPGFHAGIALGGRATRTRFFFPGAAFGLSVARTIPDAGPALVLVKIGLRAAFDLDL